MERSLLLASLLVLACGTSAAPPSGGSAVPSSTPPAIPPEAPPSSVATPSAPAASPSEAPSPPTAPAEAADAAAELLHAVPTTVTVSSAYRGDASQVSHLVDGDLETAWNSQTGDLDAPWIAITLPPDAAVTEIRMTVGFTHVAGERDLFTSNHRVAEVRVSRDGADLGVFPLDPSSRELQSLPVSGAGGTYRIVLARLVAGDRSDWREACVSELRVMGHAPHAAPGAHVPATAIASADTIGEAPAIPPRTSTPAPAQATDAAYFAVRGRGLVRLSAAGTEVLFDEEVGDFAVDDAGALWVVRTDGHLFSIAGGERREVDAPQSQALSRVALAPDGTPVVASAFGIWRRHHSAWEARDGMDGDRPEYEREQPQAIAVDGHGAIWARGQHSLFRNIGSLWTRQFLIGAGDLNVVTLAARGEVVAAATDHAVFVHHPSWHTFDHPLGVAAIREVAVGPDGVVVAGAYDGIAIFAEGAEPRVVSLEGAGIVTAVARDARGRTWVSATSAVLVLGPDLAVLRRWSVDGVPGAGGSVQMLRATGAGPELPR